jgi:hypothetical protein
MRRRYIVDLVDGLSFRDIKEIEERTGLSYYHVHKSLTEQRLIKGHMFCYYENNKQLSEMLEIYKQNTLEASNFKLTNKENI